MVRRCRRANPVLGIGLAVILVCTALAGGRVTAQATPPTPRLRVLVAHGPNLNLLGIREPQIYGTTTLAQIDERLARLAGELHVALVARHASGGGALVYVFEAHMNGVDAALIDAAGDAYHSVALHDVIRAMPFPVIEVHISNLGPRDESHRNSILTPAVRAA